MKKGYFGEWGGAFIPEVLQATFADLNRAYEEARADPAFWQEYVELMGNYSCRPTPLTFAENLTRHFGGARIYIKREDLNHTGAHKANNVMGQGLLVRRMGKRRVIAETGAGQHGVATATMAAKFGFDCTIYMGEVDVAPAAAERVLDGEARRQGGAGRRTARAPSRTPSTRPSATGWPTWTTPTTCSARSAARIPSRDGGLVPVDHRPGGARARSSSSTGRLPDRIYACVGGGSNAMGIFQGFPRRTRGGAGRRRGRREWARQRPARRPPGRRRGSSPGVAQGYKTYFLQNRDGQMQRHPLRRRRPRLRRRFAHPRRPAATGAGCASRRPPTTRWSRR